MTWYGDRYQTWDRRRTLRFGKFVPFSWVRICAAGRRLIPVDNLNPLISSTYYYMALEV